MVLPAQEQQGVATSAAGAGELATYRPRYVRRVVVTISIYVLAFAVAFGLLALVVLLIGGDPIDALRRMFRASMGSWPAVSQTINRATPLLLGGVAVALALRAGYFNIGVDGQIYAGAIVAAGLGMSAVGKLPPLVAVPAILLGGAIGGGLLATIPAILRARWEVNEIFTTVMLNFVAFYLADYLATGPWNDPMSGEAMTVRVASEARLAKFMPGGGHVGFFIAVAVALAAMAVLLRSWRGFEFRASGLNPRAARWGGIDLVKVGILALIISGVIGGLAGAIEVSGVHGRLIMGMTPYYGLLAFLVAVLALRSPAGVIPVALVFGVLIVGTDSLQRSVGLPFAAVLMFQGLVVLLVLVLNAYVFHSRGTFARWLREGAGRDG